MADMENTRNNVKRLEQQINRLVARCEQLEQENRVLQSRQDDLMVERAGLLSRTEQARSRVEAMINRLRSLEQA